MRGGDTIVAIATAMGESAIGIIRLSGPGAVAAAASVVKPSRPLAEFPSHVARRVAVVDPSTGASVDQALCVVMRAPRSYTGEDVVELSCHGSPTLLRMVTGWLIERGARLAAPGEFTRRAFLNGRLDLTQAEAVALLIGARTERAVSLAARALAGGFAERVRALQEELLDVVAGLEVTLDFPDEGVGIGLESARQAVERLRGEAEEWAAATRHGRVVQDGLTIALVGPPNAGKSSLLNALVRQERAIVAPTPGTTRDVVEGMLVIEGVPVRLLDTAGLDRPRDPIEAEGIRRSHRAIESSDLLLVVLDGSLAPDTRVLAETATRARIVVRAKSDLIPHPAATALGDAVPLSVLTGAGLPTLEARLAREVRARAGDLGDEGGIVASLRQTQLLQALRDSLDNAGNALVDSPIEIALVDLRAALSHASAILGIEVGDAVLDRVFATFCLGK